MVTTPAKLYTKADGSDYDQEAWKKKRKTTQAAISQWSSRIVRVRMELPSGSTESTPPKVLRTDGKWHCNLHDVVEDSTQKKDVMLYVSDTNVQDILDIPWRGNN